jgi:hypothetical protein
VVGGLVGGQHPEGDVLTAAAFDLPRGAHADAVGVQQHAEQELGVVGGVAVPVVAVRPVEGLKGEQIGLVAVAAQEVVGHNAFYAFAALTANALILKASTCHQT